jgi:hypothetical protein
MTKFKRLRQTFYGFEKTKECGGKKEKINCT